MGSTVFYYFLKWVESDLGGKGGPNWVENHIESFVNIAGPMLGRYFCPISVGAAASTQHIYFTGAHGLERLLGVPKALTMLLSGETRDTAQLGTFGSYVLERFFSRHERAELFRTWGGASSLLPRGNEA